MNEPLFKLGAVGHESRVVSQAEVFGRAAPNQHKITLLLQGEGDGMVGSMPILSKRPVIWFLPAGESESLDLRGPMEAWWYTFEWPHFECQAISERDLRLTSFGKSRYTRRMKPIDHGDSSRMVEYFKFLLRASGRWEMTGELEVRSLILILIAFFIDLPDQLSQSEGHRALQAFRSSLDERAFEDVSIKQLADEVKMSPEHLRGLFYERFGVQPHAYRAALRMTKARQLLAQPNMTVKEVAHLVGYADPLYFSRVFRQRYGINPSEVLHKIRH